MPEAIQLAASEWVALGFQGRATGGTFSSNFFFFFFFQEGRERKSPSIRLEVTHTHNGK